MIIYFDQDSFKITFIQFLQVDILHSVTSQQICAGHSALVEHIEQKIKTTIKKKISG